MQAPMVSSPLKQTNEVDWVTPIKAHIRDQYGDDPERYSEECQTLNRLRQDMRGAAKDSASGRDLLYRYYGQLELLDLRFPVDENHIKILFTWFDAFTHKSTSQHSLAFEKASIIFNISAVLSCYAAAQNRHEDTGLKTAYHSFQASAGMFTYINENFLHAPSTDLNHDTVRTLIALMLAQAQEVFLEKQIRDGKKVGMLAKLAMQAAFMHGQALEGVQENVNQAVFEKVWLYLTEFKTNYLYSEAQYHQAVTDNEANQYGTAIARLQLAEKQAKEAKRSANNFPSSSPANSNLGESAGSTLLAMAGVRLTKVQEKLAELTKDNDLIYHSPVSSEASLPSIAKLPAAKAISVSELYQGQDIQRIIGPDIFQRIVPMSVTESASLYDEEKAKLVRAEAERVETADGEMAASLDYLKLPGSLNILKGGIDQELHVDEEFKGWCDELVEHQPLSKAFDSLTTDKSYITEKLDQCSRKLDMEESVCEKMRSKYGGDWTQQPSSRLTTTLRNDIKNYRGAVDEASTSDAQLQSTLEQYEPDFDELRAAGEAGEADVLYQRAMIKAGASRNKGKGPASPQDDAEGNLLDADFEEGSTSVAEQIATVEEIMRKLNLIKRERAQVLKDLKDKVHNDDISQVLILNKKSITSQDHQLFKTELEKFKPHQTRLLQANHKQTTVMKDLSRNYSDLLQDKRVRSEQNKYEIFSRQRNSVMTRYRRAAQAFGDLKAGLERARGFYSEMRQTVESLAQNVESFVSNRKAEGGELLSQIEKARQQGEAPTPAGTGAGTRSADQERERLTELMDRMKIGSPGRSGSASASTQPQPQPQQPSIPHRPPPLQNIPSYKQQQQHQHVYNPSTSPPVNTLGHQKPVHSPPIYPRYPSHPQAHTNGSYSHFTPSTHGYNPHSYGPVSPQPPPGSSHHTAPVSPPPAAAQQAQQQQQYYQHAGQGAGVPAGYRPPPPPPGPPPQGQGGGAGDPWAGLSGWK